MKDSKICCFDPTALEIDNEEIDLIGKNITNAMHGFTVNEMVYERIGQSYLDRKITKKADETGPMICGYMNAIITSQNQSKKHH